MKLVYDINDRPKFKQLIILALQQMLAVLAGTIAVPMIIGNGLTPAAAMFGAGIGTIIYLMFTMRKSPVFLGTSFAFLGAMSAAFAGAATVQLGALGIILGAAMAGAVYVIIAFIIKKTGIGWMNRIMPPAVIGPTVAIIGLSLSGSAISDLRHGDVLLDDGTPSASPYAAIVCGLIALAVVMLSTSYGRKTAKLIPFILGILAGYTAAVIMTLIGREAGIDELVVMDLGVFSENLMPDGEVTLSTFVRVPDLVFLDAAKGVKDFDFSYFITVFAAYVPVAFVVFAEHIADHKNLSFIINKDLLEDPGLTRTLCGDGIGSAVGAVFGGCPNTTYGESIACVAITGNASTLTIFTAAIGCILFSFITPFIAFVESVPSCVMGGVCIALYGYIALSGFKMLREADLDKNRDMFTVSVILIAGVGGLSLEFGQVKISGVATALILGILTNLLLSKADREPENE